MTNVHLIKQLYSSRSPRGSSAGVTTAGADVGTASLVKACPAGQCLTFQGIHGHCSYMPAGGCPSGILYQSTDPIMHAPLQLVPIFYGKSWTAHQISLVKTFLSGLGGSTWMAMNAIYSDTSSYGANNPGMNSPYSYNYNTAAHPLPLGTSLDYAGVSVSTAFAALCAPRAEGGRSNCAGGAFLTGCALWGAGTKSKWLCVSEQQQPVM